MNIKPMSRLFSIAILMATLTVIQGCSLFKKQAKEDETEEYYYEEVDLEGSVIDGELDEKMSIYRASEKRINDLLHTKLEVSFNYDSQYVYGKATLTFKPYFYATNTLTLDAKGFDIHTIRQNNKYGDTLAYAYDGKEITIQLNKTYTRAQQYTIFIDYTAKPNELESEGSGHAITGDKGIYFINPTGEQYNKPTQIWSQGETEASSCWFPTIDAPNEKTAQEIYITVDEKYKTLSNGELVYSKHNKNGTRTDYWKQDLPHSPYLTMIAVGEFEVIKDKWRDKEVNYYLEKAYAPYAREIFGNTPEMIEFYSKTLGVDYPWDKYSQIVVRDFVSGAMENTGAVIHGSFVQQDTREMLYDDWEEVIAHELFHHWFGDLVTCESWSNLPLNESFATYGEYLWIDHKYGRAAADEHLHQDLKDYLAEAAYSEKDLIRFHYAKKDDMFDGHSYQKGGRVLHMLRNYVGDEAFFAALNKYLTDFRFGNAEIHDLRLVFEDITGEDLNWFFNQWFMGSGHPVLDITHEYNEETKEYTLKVYQSGSQYFRLPTKVAVYVKGVKTINPIEVLPQEYNEFTFTVSAKPDWVNFDADKVLLCEKTETREDGQWVYQFNNGECYIDKIEALEKLADFADTKKETAKVLVYKAMNDTFWDIRSSVFSLLMQFDFLGSDLNTNIIDKAKDMAINDPSAKVRAAAVSFLGSKKDDKYAGVFKKATGDSSYVVMEVALREYAKINPEAALNIADELAESENIKLMYQLKGIYATYGKGNYLPYFDTMFKSIEGNDVIFMVLDFSNYLKNSDPMIKLTGVNNAVEYQKIHTSNKFANFMFNNLYRSVKANCQERIKDIDKKLETATVDTEISELNNSKQILEQVIEKCSNMLMED